jgi:DNA-binding MarR family transcriptional regulator
MNDWDALNVCLRLNEAHARLRRKLDDELGTRHGLSLADFVLMQALARAPQGLSAQDLQQPMGVQRSEVVRQVIALEKTGWVARATDADGKRRVQLRRPGQQLVAEAAESAAAVCAAALARVSQVSSADARVLEALCESPALSLP